MTATTHLQDTLEGLRPQLAEHGTDYLPRSAIRGPINLALTRQNWRTYAAGDPIWTATTRACGSVLDPSAETARVEKPCLSSGFLAPRRQDCGSRLKMPITITNTDLLYFPVPKVACSSIKQAILAHNDPDLAARIPELTPDGRTIRHIHHVYPSPRFRPWTPVKHRKSRWFCVTRDPLRRFISAYSNRVLFHDDITRNDGAAAEAAGLSCRPDPEEFARNFDAYCRVSRSIRHHIRPQYHYLGWFPGLYDRIFRLTEISDLAEYCANVGAPLAIPHVQTGGPKLSVSELSLATQQKLKNRYRYDYRLYGAYFD